MPGPRFVIVLAGQAGAGVASNLAHDRPQAAGRRPLDAGASLGRELLADESADLAEHLKAALVR